MSEGVQKLIEYLNQTRRQAEQAVDCLNERIKELEEICEESNRRAEKLEEEVCSKYKCITELLFVSPQRDYYQRYAEQLKIENSKKWRLQERDDWKALVDSVQKDRDRLHDECLRLETELEHANNYIEQQETALAHANEQIEELTKTPTQDDESRISYDENVQNSNIVSPTSSPEQPRLHSTISPLTIRTPSKNLTEILNSRILNNLNVDDLGNQSPKSEVKYLKYELEKALAQVRND